MEHEPTKLPTLAANHRTVTMSASTRYNRSSVEPHGRLQAPAIGSTSTTATSRQLRYLFANPTEPLVHQRSSPCKWPPSCPAPRHVTCCIDTHRPPRPHPSRPLRGRADRRSTVRDFGRGSGDDLSPLHRAHAYPRLSAHRDGSTPGGDRPDHQRALSDQRDVRRAQRFPSRTCPSPAHARATQWSVMSQSFIGSKCARGQVRPGATCGSSELSA